MIKEALGNFELKEVFAVMQDFGFLFDEGSVYFFNPAYQHVRSLQIQNSGKITTVNAGVSFHFDSVQAAAKYIRPLLLSVPPWQANLPSFMNAVEGWQAQGDIFHFALTLAEDYRCLVCFFSSVPQRFENKEQLNFNRLLRIGLNSYLKNSIIDHNSSFPEEIKEKHKNNVWLNELKRFDIKMQHVESLINRVASSESTVLLLGETGTGKDLAAHAIHENSSRKDHKMVKINCAALPATLIESELFGHEKGSFTGALEQKIGKFELANNGTIFLDEIGEMPLEAQVKLLRVLQEREIERIGGKKTIKINTRIIAATNRDLAKEVSEGRFRSDLYYRLNVFPIRMPSLRERKEDIIRLARQFIKKVAPGTAAKIYTLSATCQRQLLQYHWPGNVRELEHLMERSILLSKGTVIKKLNFAAPAEGTDTKMEGKQFKTLDENERAYILKALAMTNGKVYGDGGAAELLGIHFSTLNSRIKKLGIQKVNVPRS